MNLPLPERLAERQLARGHELGVMVWWRSMGSFLGRRELTVSAIRRLLSLRQRAAAP